MLTEINDGWSTTASRSFQSGTQERIDILESVPDELPDLFGDLSQSRRRCVIVDKTVSELYGQKIDSLLRRYDLDYQLIEIGPGEACKTREAHEHLLQEMRSFGVARQIEPVFVIGGGAAHDGGGFAAAVFDRGVPYHCVSTTLTSAVDAVFAYKVAMNQGRHKNAIGAYHQARMAWQDRTFLATQDERDLREAMAEVIKVGIIRDNALLDVCVEHGARLIEERFQGRTEAGATAAAQVLARTTAGMLAELDSNPWEESNLRASWFGHSFPLIELTAGDMKHGESVALDSLIVIMIAWRRGLLGTPDMSRMVRAYEEVGLDLWHPVLEQPGLLAEALRRTTLHRGGMQMIPTPVRVGEVTYLNDVSEAELQQALDDLYAHSDATASAA